MRFQMTKSQPIVEQLTLSILIDGGGTGNDVNWLPLTDDDM